MLDKVLDKQGLIYYDTKSKKYVDDTMTNKINTLKGVKNGLAELDSNGRVPSSQLPSYVDDVIEGYYHVNNNVGKFYKESAHTTIITGESGKIYIDLHTNKTYRWSGSAYAVISETLALGDNESTAYPGDKGKIAYSHSQTAHAPSNAEKNQNAFSNIKVGTTTVSADATTDTLTLEGSNVTFTPDNTNNKVTIGITKDNVTNALGGAPLPLTGGKLTGDLTTQNILPSEPAMYNIGDETNPYLRAYAQAFRLRADNSGITYGTLGISTVGTIETEGIGRLIAGNNIPSGTNHNASGAIKLYGNQKGSTNLYPSNNTDNNLYQYLPAQSGTLALTSEVDLKSDFKSKYQVADTAGNGTYYKLFTVVPTSTYVNTNYEIYIASRNNALAKLTLYVETSNSKYMNATIYYEGNDFVGKYIKGYIYKDTENETSRLEIWIQVSSWNDIRFFEKTYGDRGSKITWDLTEATAFPTDATTVVNPTPTFWQGTANSANSATKLKTARKIDGVSFDGSADITHYGVCSTAGETSAKVINCTGFALVDGATIRVKFNNANTANTITLNVNSTGAKYVKYGNDTINSGQLKTNCIYEFVYDSSSDSYFLVGELDTNKTYSTATSSTAGLVKIGYTQSDKNYPVQLNSNGQMYVNVPWVNTDTEYTHPSTHPASMITGLATVAISGKYSDLSETPTIPTKTSHLTNDSGFKTTDTWRGIQNNLTSTSTTDSLSAAQGKILNETKLTQGTQLTNEDLDNIKSYGLYYGSGGNSVVNKPSGVDHFGLFVYKIAGGAIAQELTYLSSVYYRYFNNTSWSAWSKREFTDTKYTHPTYTARTGKPTDNQTPAFGGTATVSQITSDETGHVTGAIDRTITIPSTLSNGSGTAGLIKTSSTVTSNSGYTACPVINGVPYYKDANTTYTAATSSKDGLMSATDKTVLDAIPNKYLPFTGGVLTGTLTTQNLVPSETAKYDLGSNTSSYRQAYLKTVTLRGNTAITYGSLTTDIVGTTEAEGVARLVLGNQIVSGTEDNASGALKIYGSGKGCTNIYPGNNTDTNIYQYLPAGSGTLALDDLANKNNKGNAGLVKSGGDVTIAEGIITVNDDSHNHIISNIDGLQDALNGKATSSHTHSEYVNQNAISKLKVGTTTISATSTGDTVEITAGSNVTISADTTNKKITISSTASGDYLPLSGGTVNGNIAATNITGAWLQFTAANSVSKTAKPKICVQDDEGWLYSRTLEQILGDIGASPSNHTHDDTYLKLSGGTVNGNIIANNIVGLWLRSTYSNASNTAATKICIQDADGWIYTRTPEQILADIGAFSSTGGTVDGNITANYIAGAWLQSTADNASKTAKSKVCVQDDEGWIYTRTLEQFANDIGVKELSQSTNGQFTLTNGLKMQWISVPDLEWSQSGQSQVITTYTFPVAYSDTSYAILISNMDEQNIDGGSTYKGYRMQIVNKTTTGFTMYIYDVSSTPSIPDPSEFILDVFCIGY